MPGWVELEIAVWRSLELVRDGLALFRSTLQTPVPLTQEVWRGLTTSGLSVFPSENVAGLP